MNKREFIKSLQIKTNLTEEKCQIVSDILENYFFLKRKNQEKIKKEIEKKLTLSKTEAERIELIAIDLITNELKNKLKHPFKKQK